MKTLIYTSAIVALSVFGTASQAEESKSFSQTYDFSATGSVSVENINGSIEVSGWDKDEIALEYVITADNQKDLERIKVIIDHSDKDFDVEVDFKSSGMFNWGGGSGEVDFVLKVPNKAKLNSIDSVNGAITIVGMHSDVQADAVNGKITIEGSSGDVSADTVNGKIIIRMARLGSSQRIKADSVNGDIAVYAPSDASFRLSSETLNGDLSNHFGIEVDEGDYVGAEMNGSYNGGGASLSFDTVNGDIVILKN
ncbi:MAG: DUF4097 family beta strand repeat-containing protein [Kangiella sp.]|nr:DUF4097 family beta strand repeat-containing protein [Kangiella sp.]